MEPATGCRFVERNVGAWMHVDHGLGLYLFANANRRAPTNMHNNAISVNSMHRIRSAQDLALYNLTLTEEIEGFDGAAHLETWNSDPAWQGVREVAEQLTAIDDWCEAIFAANIVFEPLVGELFRSSLVQQAAPAQRRLRHPDGGRRRGVRLRRARPALHQGDVRAADQRPGVRRPQQGASCRAGCPPGCRAAIAAARDAAAAVVAAGRQAAPFRGRPGPRQEPLQRHPVRPRPATPRRSWPSDHVQDGGEPVQVRQHRVQQVRRHPDEQPGRRGRRPGDEHQAHNVTVTRAAVDDPRRRDRPDGLRSTTRSPRRSARSRASSTPPSSRRTCRPTTAG